MIAWGEGLFEARGYVLPMGVASALYGAMLQDARAGGLDRLTTDASHLAQRFLERRGWRVTAPETVMRNGVPLERFGMRLDVVPGGAAGQAGSQVS